MVKSAKKLRKELMKFSATVRARMEIEVGLTMLGTTGHTDYRAILSSKKALPHLSYAFEFMIGAGHRSREDSTVRINL